MPGHGYPGLSVTNDNVTSWLMTLLLPCCDLIGTCRSAERQRDTHACTNTCMLMPCKSALKAVHHHAPQKSYHYASRWVTRYPKQAQTQAKFAVSIGQHQLPSKVQQGTVLPDGTLSLHALRLLHVSPVPCMLGRPAHLCDPWYLDHGPSARCLSQCCSCPRLRTVPMTAQAQGCAPCYAMLAAPRNPCPRAPVSCTSGWPSGNPARGQPCHARRRAHAVAMPLSPPQPQQLPGTPALASPCPGPHCSLQKCEQSHTLPNPINFVALQYYAVQTTSLGLPRSQSSSHRNAHSFIKPTSLLQQWA